jgi:hypothetical protein
LLCARHSFSNHRASGLTVRNTRAGSKSAAFSGKNVFHGGTWLRASATAWITRNTAKAQAILGGNYDQRRTLTQAKGNRLPVLLIQLTVELLRV